MGPRKSYVRPSIGTRSDRQTRNTLARRAGLYHHPEPSGQAQRDQRPPARRPRKGLGRPSRRGPRGDPGRRRRPLLRRPRPQRAPASRAGRRHAALAGLAPRLRQDPPDRHPGGRRAARRGDRRRPGTGHLDPCPYRRTGRDVPVAGRPSRHLCRRWRLGARVAHHRPRPHGRDDADRAHLQRRGRPGAGPLALPGRQGRGHGQGTGTGQTHRRERTAGQLRHGHHHPAHQQHVLRRRSLRRVVDGGRGPDQPRGGRAYRPGFLSRKGRVRRSESLSPGPFPEERGDAGSAARSRLPIIDLLPPWDGPAEAA
jgi:hypothetical protein